MSKKNTAKKVTAPKPAKVAKPKKSSAKFVSFSVGAVIPTQQYGNIQPRIEVSAANYEDARAFAMPLIEKLYSEYAEEPLNGRTPKFMGKIVETVKTVAPAPQTAPTAPKAVEKEPSSASSVAAPVAAPESSVPAKPKSESVLKAEKAISLALSNDALIAISEQITKSVKIANEDKPDLQIQVLKRRNEFK